jgi:hypothetical protein
VIKHPDSFFLSLFIVWNLFIYTQHNIYRKQIIGDTPPDGHGKFECIKVNWWLRWSQAVGAHVSPSIQSVTTNSSLVVPAMHSERWFQEYMWEKDKDCHSQGCHKNPAEEFHCLLHSPYIIFDVISVSFLSQIYSNSRCAVDMLTAVVMSWLTNYYTCLLYVLNCSFLIKLN